MLLSPFHGLLILGKDDYLHLVREAPGIAIAEDNVAKLSWISVHALERPKGSRSALGRSDMSTNPYACHSDRFSTA